MGERRHEESRLPEEITKRQCPEVLEWNDHCLLGTRDYRGVAYLREGLCSRCQYRSSSSLGVALSLSLSPENLAPSPPPSTRSRILPLHQPKSPA